MVRTNNTTRLRELRKAKGVSLNTLATALGVTKQAVSWWELGRGQMTLGTACEICSFLGVPLTDLVQPQPQNSS